MGFWGWFYLGAVGFTLLHALLPLTPLKGRHQALGAEIIAMSWLASYAARYVTGDATPLVAYAGIDAITAGLFLFVALRHRAVWAAVCVILHALMGMLHVAFFLSGQTNENGYIWLLNGLFASALVVINIAIPAGRYDWGAGLDQFFVHRLRGWTFSGVRRRRLARHMEKT